MRWLPQVKRDDAKADLIAGLAGAIVVLPQGVALATIAGMPPEYGLYAGMVPAIIAAFFGSSRHLVSGPTTAASVVLFSSLSVYALPGSNEFVALALTLTVMVGLFELILGLARMGALVNFISHSVVVGFTAGAAILIIAKQLKHFFGIDLPRGENLHGIIWSFVQQVEEVNYLVTAVGLVTLLSGVAIRKIWPKAPYLIIAMCSGSALALIFQELAGTNETGIALVGALPSTLPPLSSPVFSMDVIKELAPTALAVTLFALTEAVSIGRSLASREGYRIDSNQEFIGQGLSNIAGSFFSGYVATGSFNRSALNLEAGARTPLAAAFAGLLLMFIMLFIAPLVAYLPNAAMAGVLFLVAWGLIDFKGIKYILKNDKRESSVFLVTASSAIFVDLEFAIFAGVLLSLILYLEKVSKPAIRRRTVNPYSPKRSFITDPTLAECPQLRFARIDGPIFFGSANHIQGTFELFRTQNPGQKHLALIASGINFVDMQGGQALTEEARLRRNMNGGLYLIQVHQGLWNSLENCGCLDEGSVRNVFQTKGAAIHGIYQKLDKAICAQCEHRIFRECQNEFGFAPQPA
jgi:SulP family sulfate permease